LTGPGFRMKKEGMPLPDLSPWQHEHAFGVEGQGDGERRTRWVVGLTLAMMVAEVVAGTLSGSMALLADGWHMGTHAAALGVTLFAYVYARRHARDPRYSFGTGKVGALGGFASAVGLAVVALLVLVESARRLASPVAIRFEEAIAVAFVGLAVNLGCALLLREHDHGHPHGSHADENDGGHDDDHDHDHDRGHGHGHDHAGAHGGGTHQGHGHADDGGHHDHNLRSAYFHVLADALTSVCAILALFGGRLLGWTWLDPTMGIVGSLVIARWSWGLLRDTSAVLLDAELSPARSAAIRTAVEAVDPDGRVTDLHVWRVGRRHLAAIVSVVSGAPRPPAEYKAALGRFGDLAHLTVEVHGLDAGRG
jgi:cation diffusion facilitator family transporter